MKVHILGICGTFMAGVAVLAKQMGYTVTGSDANVYPPMSDQLREQGIELFNGYQESNLSGNPDVVVVGNAIKRSNPEFEAVLNQGINYTSGPQWLADHVLSKRWVLAVSGTHGKTTTTSMLTWILDFAKLSPGFLIGGVPENFGVSARLGDQPFFVIEADEYDSALFDKRAKFIHYRPRTVILNNLEFDHADIYANLEQIKTQFHHLVRTIPANGLIVSNAHDENLVDVLQKGCWTPVELFGSKGSWHAELVNADGSEFKVYYKEICYGIVKWSLLGMHNVSNALAAIAAARHAGVKPEVAIEALFTFQNVKRRMEIKGVYQGVTVYDDFAHHPTAIKTTLEGLRHHIGERANITVVLEFGSYTMRSGVHSSESFVQALRSANQVILKKPAAWDAADIISGLEQAQAFEQTDDIVNALRKGSRSGDHILVMSNTGFDGFFKKLAQAFAG